MSRQRLVGAAVFSVAVLSLAILIGSAQEREGPGLKVAILLASSGRGDKSYNDAALAGLAVAKTKGTLTVDEVLPPRADEYASFIDRLAASGPDLIIGVGFLYADAFRAAGTRHLNTRFLLLDSEVVNVPNLRSVTFRADEGSFLVGVAAAAESRQGAIGFIGGMNIPIIQTFQCGFQTGAKWASKELGREIKSHAVYIGSTPDAFSNPERGRDLSRSMITRRRVDVVYHASGASGDGVIDAARKAKVKAIGVDSDQSHIAPGVVITSMRKRLDRAVDTAIDDIRKKAFSGGVQRMTVANHGVDLVLPGLLAPTTQTLVETARAGIVSGRVTVCAR